MRLSGIPFACWLMLLLPAGCVPDAPPLPAATVAMPPANDQTADVFYATVDRLWEAKNSILDYQSLDGGGTGGPGCYVRLKSVTAVAGKKCAFSKNDKPEFWVGNTRELFGPDWKSATGCRYLFVWEHENLRGRLRVVSAAE